MTELHAIPVWGIGEVVPGDSIADLIVDALATGGLRFHDGDILVVKHKIVSKAEGRMVELATVKPSPAAKRFAAKNDVDARVIELALREAKRVVRKQHVLITETAHGLVCANSGIDVSNVDGGKTAVLLPLDPDRSAAPHSSPNQEAHHAAYSCDHRRQLRPRLARGSERSRHRPCRHEADSRLSRPARRLWLQNARHRRVRCRRTGVRCGPGLRQERARSGLYNSGLSLSSRQRQRAANRPSRGERLVPTEGHSGKWSARRPWEFFG